MLLLGLLAGVAVGPGWGGSEAGWEAYHYPVHDQVRASEGTRDPGPTDCHVRACHGGAR